MDIQTMHQHVCTILQELKRACRPQVQDVLWSGTTLLPLCDLLQAWEWKQGPRDLVWQFVAAAVVTRFRVTPSPLRSGG